MASPSTFDVGDLFRVDGMVAVITGGGTGIGLMMAKALAANGAAKVYIVARRKEKLEAATKDNEFGNIVPIQGDVTSKESLAAVAKQIEDDVGFVNLVIANSGTAGPGAGVFKEDASLAENTPMDEFNETLHINITGVLYTIAAFLDLLDRGNKKGNLSQHSQVIGVSSVGGFCRDVLTNLSYQTSKAGVTHLMKMLSTTCGKYNIRHNTLAPGLFPSDLAATFFSEGDVSQTGSLPATVLSAQRAGNERDMGATILYMASKAGAYCDGSVVVVDGGSMSALKSTY
ncbi:MAG: hypothetical protein M1815_000677 [Lichina confinis]|nr:MAG: hypothetical protein M1815_000677 [Lichina confinis]